MAEIKFVKQKDANGCGIACMAMVLNKSYKEIKRDFVHGIPKDGLTTDMVMEYLGNRGYAIVHKKIKRWTNIDFARVEMLKPFAPIHLVITKPSFDASSFHLVVMTNEGKFLCPSGDTDKMTRNSYAITDVIGLYK